MKKLRQLLQHHVSTHESDVDPQEIWDGILEKQKPKKRNKFFFIIPFCLLLFVSGGLFFTLNQPSYSPVSSLDSDEYSYQSEIKEDNKALTYQSESENNIGKSHLDNVQTFNSTNENINKASTTDFLSNSILDTPHKEKNPFLTLLPTSEKPTINTNSSNSILILPNAIRRNITDSKSASEELNTFDNSSINPIESLPSLPFQSIISKAKLSPIILSDFNPIAIGMAKPSLFSVRLLTGVGLISTKIESNDNVSTAYLENRRSSISALESLSSRLSLSYAINKNISLSTGIDYLRINEKFVWSGSILSDTDGNTFTGLEKDQEGNLILDVDFFTEDYYEAVEKNIVSFNNHEFISLPIIGEYNFSFNKLRSRIYAGTIVNLLTKSRGKLLNEESVPVDLNNIDSRTGARYFSGIEIGLPLRGDWMFTGGLEYSYQNLSISRLRKNYSIYSVNLGLQYRI